MTTIQAKRNAIEMFKSSNRGVKKFTVKTVQPVKKVRYPTGITATRAVFQFTADGYRPTNMAYEIGQLGTSLTKA